MEEETKLLAEEVKRLTIETSDLSHRLAKKGEDALKLGQALEIRWALVSSRSKEQAIDYAVGRHRLAELGINFSNWIKDNPEMDGAEFRRRMAVSRSTSTEATKDLLESVRLNRLHRLNVQLPQLQLIAEELDGCARSLQAIITRQY
jgi:hypothetical protein